ncbi:endonuclease domain-containing protein [Streptomyces somaliensis]|uniref:endonuclease domain-containing protein n=1 Tax=Streptomyces somaliensis TaxID=78355 RepID=UPI00131A06DE
MTSWPGPGSGRGAPHASRPDRTARGARPRTARDRAAPAGRRRAGPARPAAVRRHVDLRHAAGKVPGVLCFNCNPAIGKPRGDRGVTGRAAAHVEGNSWKPTLEPQGVCRLPS